MKNIALLLGLLLVAPAMGQADAATSSRDDNPAAQRSQDGQKKAKKQDPQRQGQGRRGADRRPDKPGGGIPPGLLRRFDTNGDGRLSNEEKLAGRRRIAQWRDRNRGDKPQPGGRGSRGSRGSRGNGPRPQPGTGGNGNGPKPKPGSRGNGNGPKPQPGSRGSRGNGPRPQPGAGGNGNGPKPQPGARGNRGSRNQPRPRPGGRGARGNRRNGPRPKPNN